MLYAAEAEINKSLSEYCTNSLLPKIRAQPENNSSLSTTKNRGKIIVYSRMFLAVIESQQIHKN